MRRTSHETYETVFSVAYLGLVTNALLAVGLAPLLAVLLTTDPASSWPLLAVLLPLATPTLAAAFAVFAAYSADPTIGVIRTFARTWRTSFRRAATIGALAAATLVVLGVDAHAAATRPVAAWAVPVLGVVALLVVATTLLALVATAEVPGARLRAVLKAALYLGARRWYLTVVSLAVLALLVGLLAAKPALAIGLATAPLLYVVWANSRFSLRPALPAHEAPSPT
ncbi:MAG: DUF624 domain-containing protein [Cellulomonas sp.]|uniref:DUF624 domain-containing protein n=1 Tax=Cellulomonas sp. 73-92 TaxID=1895740 RepID=UPI000925B83D|nr:DUF624 domain-containing protein [Cellulomonas sp. 73-92]MBN9374396.1 DUF624 domain-containing protein [Cellulomonas sp.]OJV80153.1 MAG: hypothetical protein BGO37_01820 [Cellulomonas sp. 73-92]